MLPFAYSRLFAPFFTHEICALCSETFYACNIRSSVIDCYAFRADVRDIKPVCGTILCLSLLLSAHLIILSEKS